MTVADQKTPRRFWQFHLSTLFVASLVGAVLLASNVTLRSFALNSDQGASGYGWPLHFLYYPRLDGWPVFAHMDNPYGPAQFDLVALLANLALAGIILASVMVVLEFAARKGPKTL